MENILFDINNKRIMRRAAHTHARPHHQPLNVITSSTDTDFYICSQKKYKEEDLKLLTNVNCPNLEALDLGLFKLTKTNYESYYKAATRFFVDKNNDCKLKGDFNIRPKLIFDMIVPLQLIHTTQQKVRLKIDSQEAHDFIFDSLIGGATILVFDFERREIQFTLDEEALKIIETISIDDSNSELIIEAQTLHDDVLKLIELYGIEGTQLLEEIKVRSSTVQKLFRSKLLIRDKGCLLCGINEPELLIASHIKPASVSNVFEKASLDNGLTLCAIHDKLFDKGFITFNPNNGDIDLSQQLETNIIRITNTNPNYKLPKSIFNAKMSSFLAYHNSEVFKR